MSILLLGEREVARAQAYVGVRTEHFTSEIQQGLLQIGERHVFVNIEGLDLMEEAVGTRRDGFVAVHTAGAYYADGRFGVLHHTALDRGGVGAQKHIGITLYEEGVLHVACRMVGCEIQRGEHVPVVFNLRTFCHGESEAGEYGDNLVAHNGEGMTRAE